jgi:hypothetical protein
LLLVAVVLVLISSWEFDRSDARAGVGVLACGVVAAYLGWRLLPWPGLRRRLRDVLREDSAPFSGVSLWERLVVLVLDSLLFFLLILIAGWAWALAISAGIYSLWVWLANRSGR